jgi:rfaE bifunctional protein kinase chain/domain
MTPAGILTRIGSLRALVIGDICLDRWCAYEPALAEPSRETGLHRVAVVRTAITAGGGGTVANNLAALGAARVAVLGVRGDDGHGYELGQALARAGIDASLMVTAPVATFTYTKLLNAASGEEDLGRIDYVNPDRIPSESGRAIVERLLASAAAFDVILVSDQAETRHEGVVTASVRDVLARLHHPLVWVDSRMRAELFRGVLVKPNEREAREACARLGIASFRALRDAIGHPRMMITHGGRGVLVLDGGAETWVPTRPAENPVDICGAGDSFSAGAALALAAGAPPCDAARFGNLVASITIMKKGTGTASPAEVRRAAAEVSS